MKKREFKKRLGASILNREFYYRYFNVNDENALEVGVHEGWRRFPDAPHDKKFCDALQKLYDNQSILVLSKETYDYLTGFNYRKMNKRIFEELYDIVEGLDVEMGE